MTDLFIKVKIQQEQGLPFVLFCKPNSDKVVGLFQKNDHLYFLENYEEKGFVFAPFDAEIIPFIPLEHSNVYVDKVRTTDYIFDTKPSNINSSSGKDFFEDNVSKAIEAINGNQFLKVVLSRKETIEISDFDIQTTLKKMISYYPTAFNYCFSHPKIGTWIGATPEQFLKTNGNSLQTVALAGTKLVTNSNPTIWEDKEIQEQQLVTDFIAGGLKGLVKDMVVSNPYSVRAGNLLHIKTDILATLKSKKKLKGIIDALHPTSAVCGFPKLSAKDFIHKNEGYDREYYSGFLGELNIDLVTFRTLQTDLFVNLRCMKVSIASPDRNRKAITKAELFMGCGITKDSNAGDEYWETVNKSLTMKKCIL